MRFRPKIWDIIQEFDMDSVLIIPKNGGLQTVIGKTLQEMGIDEKDPSGRSLDVQIYRGEDIPQVVEDMYFDKRVKAVGLTGDDLFDEYAMRNPGTIVQLLETVDWDDENAMFRRPTLRWLTRKGETPQGKVKIAINKKYELTSRAAVDERKDEMGIEPEIRVYAGNTEQTVADGINDMGIEIVYGGKTVKENNLEIRDKVRFSDFAIIGVDETSPLIFKRDYEMIEDRVKNPVENSYISLLASDPNKAFKKMGEEFAEYLGELRTCKTLEDRKKVAGEYSDLVCFMSLNMAMSGIEFKDVTKTMYRRLKRS